MATIKEMLETEHRRDRQDVIHLFGEGTFWRAYEQSAWLYSRFAAVPLKAARHKSKQFPEGSYVMVGHPQASLREYLPTDSIQSESEGVITIALPESAFPPEATFELLLTDFTRWKSELPYVEKPAENKKEQGNTTLTTNDATKKHIPQNLMDVARQILAYPLDNRTPMETIRFVSDLKRQLSFLVKEM